MTDNASKTAEFMAFFRAIESGYPRERRLFEDCFARGFLRTPLKLASYIPYIPFMGSFAPWLIDKKWSGARPSGIARTRLIDDFLISGLQNGIEQVVILGAGYDCRAYRIPAMQDKLVFEVDHPNTQAEKRKKLEKIMGSIPSHVVFAAIDFNKDKLENVLDRSGFDKAKKTFFIWEGVTNYLSSDAVDKTIRVISTSAAGSQLLFTYVHRDIIDAPQKFLNTSSLQELLNQAGEPWTFGFYPEELQQYLEIRGLKLLEDMSSVDYRIRYMNRFGKHLEGYAFYRAAFAEVI